MVLFVGDKPSNKMKPGAKPFEGAACEERLLMWIEDIMTEVDYDPRYKIINSINTNMLFLKIYVYFMGYPIIALGNEASKRLIKAGISHFKLPHPSGRNRQINDKEFISKKLTECKKWINE